MLYLENFYKRNNFKLVYGAGSITYIFISSNGLYPDNDSDTANKILESDHFEWENISKSKKIQKNASKIIFLRDIYKHSYVDGINERVNTLPKLIEFIKQITRNDKKIYLIGNSGGGYLSLILSGCLKNCEKVFSFGGVISLYKWTGSNDDYTFTDAKHLVSHIKDLSNYFDTRPFIKNSNCRIFHFWSSGNRPDSVQVDLIEKEKFKNVITFGFDSSIHGKTINSFDYETLFTCDDNHLRKLEKRFGNKININKNLFSLYNLGCIKYFMCLIKRVFRKVKRLLKHGV